MPQNQAHHQQDGISWCLQKMDSGGRSPLKENLLCESMQGEILQKKIGNKGTQDPHMTLSSTLERTQTCVFQHE